MQMKILHDMLQSWNNIKNSYKIANHILDKRLAVVCILFKLKNYFKIILHYSNATFGYGYEEDYSSFVSDNNYFML
jgi:hypothetical protein